MAYRIKDWDKNFEKNRTREVQAMSWVAVPNRMDGDGYTELVDHPNAAAHFGAWIAIVEIASRRDVRGYFPQEGAILSHYLARVSRLPATVFLEVIPRLLEIGWIEEIQPLTVPSQEGATTSQASATESQEGAPRARPRQNNTEEKRREQYTRETASACHADELGWDALMEAAARARMVFDPSPESVLCLDVWRKLSLSEKRDSIDGINRRVDVGQFDDPQFTPKLETYLRKKQWRESIRPRAPDLKEKTRAKLLQWVGEEVRNGTKILG